MFYPALVPGEQLFEIARRTFDTPEFHGIECIEVEAKSVINKVPAASRVPFDYTINLYRGCTHACVYCFARPTHTYLDMDAGRDFETKIVVKVNAPEVLRRELAAKRWKGDHIAMGTPIATFELPATCPHFGSTLKSGGFRCQANRTARRAPEGTGVRFG